MKNSIIKILFVFLLFTGGLFSQSKSVKNNLKPIYVGFSISLFNDVDIRDATAAIKMWGDELLKGMDAKFTPETNIYETNAEIVEALNSKKIDLIALPVTDYLEIRNKTEIEPNLTTLVNGKPGYEFIVVVRKDKNYKKIEDLKNKIINIPSKTGGGLIKIWLTVLLNEKGKNFDKFFAEVRETEKPSKSLLPVFFNQIDASIVPAESFYTILELNPQLKNELTIIEKSPILLNGIMCVSKNIDSPVKKALLDVCVKLEKTVSGKQILNLFKSENLILFEDSHLKNILELTEKYAKIKKKKM
ncbi:MAG: PhnD/SsuA/transferrin family substrate-binding protein [Ignavibacteriae bacterium]|nr:PhnD/SsuA/transferrin family substrate-binding protein [Ignavibacteriota bacterium]